MSTTAIAVPDKKVQICRTCGGLGHRELTLAPTQIDLCTLADVQNYLDPDNITVWSATQLIEQQTMITAASQDWLEWTGRRTLNRAIPFNDRMDGTGAYRQFVKDYPILQVQAVYVEGISVPPGSYGTNGQITPGWVIDEERHSLSIIGVQNVPIRRSGSYQVTGTLSRMDGGWRFGRQDNSNYQNVFIQYTAGNTWVPAETTEITGATYSVDNGGSGTFTMDLGVLYIATALPLTVVASNPQQGQYSVSNAGVYTFNAADDGQLVSISYAYNGAPPDIEQAVARMVALYWKRQKTQDEKSVIINEVGTRSMRDWHLPPDIQIVVDRHRRKW